MKTIEQLYKPYNFSATRCYIATIQVEKVGYLKIEHKLPAYITKLKGIFISVNCLQSTGRVTGYISLNFKGQSCKIFQQTVRKTYNTLDCSYPLYFNEPIVPNSFMQGYYLDNDTSKTYPFTLTIYLHYEQIK